MFCSSFKWAASSLVQRVLIEYVWPSGCPRLREVVKLVWDHSPDEGEPVVAALSPRFSCLGTGCTGASCSLR